MIARRCSLPAVLFGLWVLQGPAAAAPAEDLISVPPPPEPVAQPREPARLEVQSGRPLTTPAAPLNQQIAERIAVTLRQNAQLRKFRVDISYQNGVAELSGHANGQAQHDEIIRTVQGVPGVDRVVDHLELRVVALKPAQIETPPPPLAAPGLPPAQAPPFAPPAGQAPLPGAPPAPPFPPPPGFMPRPLGPPLNGPPAPEPTPIFGGYGPVSPTMPPPRMPPNAWPTYAPYNNYSRVAYPTLYPYQSWPFIGPNYPFPKIPPGWRSISLQWQDGCWWYGKNASSHDWWRIRYW